MDREIFKEFSVYGKTSKYRSKFVCINGKGKYILEKGHRVRDVEMLEGVRESIRSNYSNIQLLEKDKNQKPYYEYRGEVYICYRVNGREVSFSSRDEVMKVVGSLKRFHNNRVKGCRSKDIVARFEKGRRFLETTKRKVSKSGKLTEVDVYLIKNYEYYMESCSRGIEAVREMDSREVFCHGGIKEKNILINEEREIYFMNFKKGYVSNPIIDVMDLIYEVYKLTGELLLEEIEKEYFGVSGSNELEKVFVYPYRLIDVLEGHYIKNRGFIVNKTIKKIEVLEEIKDIMKNKIDF